MELRDLIPLLFPEEQQAAVGEALEDFDGGDPVWLFDRYYDVFEGYETAAQIEEDIGNGLITPGVFLTWYMCARGMLLQLDWRGEEERGLLCDFINYRLEVLGGDFAVGAGPLYEKFDEDRLSDSPRLTLGDHLPLLFCYLSRQLNPEGIRLISFDIGDDQYYVGPFSEETASALLDAGTTDVILVDTVEGEG